MPCQGGQAVVACVPCGNNVGTLPAHEWRRWRLGVHIAPASACLKRLGPGIATASGSATAMHALSGSTAGGQGEEGAAVLRLVGLG
jgi:hypothetical protein